MSDKIFEGKTLDDAILAAETELGLNRDLLKIEVIAESDKGVLGFKWGKKVSIKAIQKNGQTPELPENIEGIAKKLLDLTHLAGEVKTTETFDEIIVNVDPGDEDESLFIGRKGKNLDAFQYLINKIIDVKSSEKVKRITVDCSGYRARRRAKLENMARDAASRVKKENQSYTFPPMQAGDRRIIHIVMKEKGLDTESRGSGSEKKVVVFPPNH